MERHASAVPSTKSSHWVPVGGFQLRSDMCDADVPSWSTVSAAIPTQGSRTKSWPVFSFKR